jgi:hypothetical protein
MFAPEGRVLLTVAVDTAAEVLFVFQDGEEAQ